MIPEPKSNQFSFECVFFAWCMMSLVFGECLCCIYSAEYREYRGLFFLIFNFRSEIILFYDLWIRVCNNNNENFINIVWLDRDQPVRFQLMMRKKNGAYHLFFVVAGMSAATSIEKKRNDDDDEKKI